MKTFIQPGDCVSVTLAANVVGGAGVLQGSLFGLACVSGSTGDEIEIATTGVYDVAKTAAQAWTVGARVYWNDTAGEFSTTASGNTLVGVALMAAANPSSMGRVRLNGTFTQ